MSVTNRIGDRSLNSTSGQNASYLIENTSNTANSNSVVQFQSGGTSGGNAAIRHNVTGSFSWMRGQNNSDSQAYAVAGASTLSIANAMRISTVGAVNYPGTSSFLAYVTNSTGGVTGTGTVYTITGYTTVYDQHNDFNTSNGKFTAPITGYYLLIGMGNVTAVTAAMTKGSVYFQNSAAAVIAQTTLNTGVARLTVGGTWDGGLNVIQFMAAGTSVDMRVQFSNGAADQVVVSGGIGFTFFSAQLIA